MVPPSGPTDADTVGQGQGTSFSVALAAGIAALWLAHHGRATVVAAAHARGETVQAIFRRLLQATAHGPTPWDSGAMGPGIVDARALLAAGFDLGLGAVNPPTSASTGDPSNVASLVAEVVDPSAATSNAVDWHRFGPELATTLLRRLPAPPPGPPPADEVSTQLARNIRNPRLRSAIELGDAGLAASPLG